MHDLRRLRAFHAVAERRSFSEAALTLGYAQSVVSHHVSALEREFGLTLVDRGKRPVGLTEAGERLNEHAMTLLGAVTAAEEEMRALAGLETGTVRVGAFLTACTSFVPAALARFKAAHPQVEVEVEQIDPANAPRRLRTGELDVAVTFEGDLKGLASTLLGHDPYRIIVPPGHRLARRRELELADLAGERFTGPHREAGVYREMLDRLCEEAGFTPEVTYVVNDVTVGRAFVAAGVCVALMSELGIQQPRPDVAVKPVRGLDPMRSVHASWLRGRRSPAITPMVEALVDAAAARLGQP